MKEASPKGLASSGADEARARLAAGKTRHLCLLNMSETYSENTPCTLNLTVTDQDGYPVDGARVNLYSTNTQYGTEYKLSAGNLWTDAQGKISVKLGTGKKYYFKISHSKYGSFPETSGQIYVLISSNTTAGQVYNKTFTIPASAQIGRASCRERVYACV